MTNPPTHIQNEPCLLLGEDNSIRLMSDVISRSRMMEHLLLSHLHDSKSLEWPPGTSDHISSKVYTNIASITVQQISKRPTKLYSTQQSS
jgi:hypothetical protein